MPHMGPLSVDPVAQMSAEHATLIALARSIERLINDSLALDEEKAAWARQLCTALAIHLHVEEEWFYPVLRDATPHGAEIDAFEVEHEGLRTMIDGVLASPSDDPLFDARFMQLCATMRAHFHTEESQLFLGVRLAPEVETALAHDMSDCRAEQQAAVAGGHDLHFEREAADPVGAVHARAFPSTSRPHKGDTPCA